MLYDAHCHLHDSRLVRAGVRSSTAARCVVNGTCEDDWPLVAELAANQPNVISSFGLHPWFVNDRSTDWRSKLDQQLLAHPGAPVGEIGLDRWIPDFDLPAQEEVFLWQLNLAAERDLAASIHCLRAWGRLLELLGENPRPRRGFLLHSYGGPVEMVKPLAKLGARFSFCGYFLADRKEKTRDAIREVPLDRLLIETDAPDQALPEELDRFQLTDPESGKRLNHPDNLAAVYAGAASFLGVPLDELTSQVEANFNWLFGATSSHQER